jgi:gliding motility-associated-like protein
MNHLKIFVYRLLLVHIAVFCFFTAESQCPVNIGFENGNFDGWQCSVGTVDAPTDGSGSYTLTLNSMSGPVSGRHTLISATGTPQYDQYGGFPIVCPNGSGYSIKLGNNQTGKEAERVSYTFTIPPDQNNYSIIYNYAVVFQNPPDHFLTQQPRFNADIFDETTGNYISCSSFSYAASSGLPGFVQSSIGTQVFYKNWTPVTIKLSGYAGRTIRLEFTTNDCTKGGHFGYAYIDVNEDCESPISGNTHCLGDTLQTLTAPYGFSGYRWFTQDFSKILGTEVTLNLMPPPPENTVFAVEVTPYPDQGCVDTVYTTIRASNEKIKLQVKDTILLGCVSTGIDLVQNINLNGSSQGLRYSYFTDASQSSYVISPKFITTSGTYYIKAVNASGCTVSKAVSVTISPFVDLKLTDTILVTRPTPANLYDAPLGDTRGLAFSFWYDQHTTLPIPDPTNMSQSGTYYIKATNAGGCYSVEPVDVIVLEPKVDVPNAFSPNGDGIHDTWEIPILKFYPDCVVDIFNRLGQQIFHSVGYNTPWDGRYKGVLLPIGTYYYVIKPSNIVPYQGGSVTIVR